MGKVTRLNGEVDNQRLHLRDISGETEAPRATVGQDLRAARLNRGDELSRVSHALRISKAYLEALESDRPERLPGRTYAVGFVRTYANYLGLDAPSLVARYKLATAGMAESAPQVGPAPESSGFRLGAGWTVLGVAAAVLLVLGIYALSKPPLPAAPAPTIAPAHSTSSPALAHAARRALSPKLATQAPVASAAALPTGQVLGMQNRGARVVLHARALAHVLIEGPGGKVYINRLLHPGDVYRVPNLVGLSLTTPNGGAVALELDGRDLGAAGRSGHIVEALSLDPAAIADRKMPAFPASLTR